jgi:hypothetical protein
VGIAGGHAQKFLRYHTGEPARLELAYEAAPGFARLPEGNVQP